MIRNQCKEAWEGFSTELNGLGPPKRTPLNDNVYSAFKILQIDILLEFLLRLDLDSRKRKC